MAKYYHESIQEASDLCDKVVNDVLKNLDDTNKDVTDLGNMTDINYVDESGSPSLAKSIYDNEGNLDDNVDDLGDIMNDGFSATNTALYGEYGDGGLKAEIKKTYDIGDNIDSLDKTFSDIWNDVKPR